ncbi:MAG: hypothetical protein LLF82_001083 [Dehalococcoides mccartyi]|uniref:RNA-directed DNA polymerase n=1 Tax=Dehalococcoides mccartyi TaxID=61435 RepID=UPI00242D68D0|nr:RNA-directed DNA polymerase [Dehalococcoides mccartyi]MCF7635598.1 hypothetical protein [Dehalococcoides mccartyi]MEA2122533.1 hypothetical protein [Dehalococcoides mccartyi]
MTRTALFGINREKALKELFTSKQLVYVWRRIVKGQMRSLAILDLYDYYDFNFNIKEKVNEIRNALIKTQYRASNPLIYRVEKKYGISRHLMIPSPSDALVFQTITENIAPNIIKKQPSKNAYYARSKHSLPLPHQVSDSEYPEWWILWPKYQKSILKFTRKCKYLVVTDISNYYDNIGLRELRNIISSHAKCSEVLLDLLFNIIEQLAWHPDYLPISFRGLPQINIEAIRLLAHVMLFDADTLLKEQTKGNYVRWCDDINIGVDTYEQAFTILGDLNDTLKSRGLALNLSKTRIYTSIEAKQHFLFDENVYLEKMSKVEKADPDYSTIKLEFIKKFRNHVNNGETDNWDKVTKRYFTIAGDLNIFELRKYTIDLYTKYPTLRPNIIRYLGKLKFTSITAGIILNLLSGIKRYDDVALFDFCKLITDSNIPKTPSGNNFIKSVDDILKQYKTNFDLYCYFWFLAKYGKPYRIMNLIQKSKPLWCNEPFLARQVISIAPRLLKFNEDATKNLLKDQARVGPSDAASVANSIEMLIDLDKVSSHMSYIFPPKNQQPFPIAKYLILTAILSSTKLLPAEKTRLIDKTISIITDKWYLHWLKEYKLI